MKMQKAIVLFLTWLFLIMISKCVNVEKMGTELTPVFQGIVCLNKFYQQYSRLPGNDEELIKFAGTEKLDLELSKFKTFRYYKSSDSTFTLDYELLSGSNMKGSFNLQIEKK